METILETLRLPFMQRAFLIGTLSAIPFGLIGTFIVVRRITYLAGAIAHCAFGGIGIGLFLQHLLAGTVLGLCLPPLGVSIAFAILGALLVGMMRCSEREDTVIGVVWATGMALGILLLEMTPGNVNIGGYLFGNILLIKSDDITVVSILGAIIVAFVAIFFKRLEAVCFDAEFAALRGVNTKFYYFMLLILTALTVVLLMQIIGIILVIAMLTLPAATAARFANRLFSICCLAVLDGLVCTWVGLILSVAFNLSTGATIVLVTAIVYVVSQLYVRSSRKQSSRCLRCK